MLPEFTTIRSAWEIAAAFALWGLAILVAALHAKRDAATPWKRRAVRLVLRVGFLSSLLLLFLAPQIKREKTLPATIAVVVDDSASMTRLLGDGPSVQKRADALASFLQKRGESLRRRVVRVDLSVTDVADALLDAKPSCAFFLTDGLVEPPASLAAPCPVYPIVVGSSRPATNWTLSNVRTTVPSKSGDAATVEATIGLVGETSDRTGVVELWRKNDDAEPTLVWSQTVSMPGAEKGGQEETFQKSWTFEEEDSATYVLLVVDQRDADRLAPSDLLPGASRLSEFCTADNAISFTLSREPRKTRVLLVDDLPRYEYRYLRETLRREPTVELRTLLLSADPEVAQSDPLAIVKPLSRKELAAFDVAIVGDLTHEEWQEKLAGLVEVVKREDSTTSLWFAGATRLLLAPERQSLPETALVPGTRGEESASVLDADWRFVPSPLTAQIWPELDAASLPRFTRVLSGIAPNVQTATLLLAQNAENEPTPVLMAESLGQNAVLWQACDELWRLQTLSDKSVYRTFVLQTLDYLTDPQKRSVDPAASLAASDPKRNESGTRDPFVYFAENNPERLAELRERENVAATLDNVRALASDPNDVLDLRDLGDEESLVQTRAFCERVAGGVPSTERTIVEGPLASPNLVFPITLLLFLLVLLL